MFNPCIQCGFCSCARFCPTPPMPVILYPAICAVIEELSIIFGIAQPGNWVHVCVDGTCQAVMADANGKWRLTLTQPLDEGKHLITASQTNCCEKTSARAVVEFTVCLMPDAPIILFPEPGDVTGTLSLISGTAELGNTVRVCVDNVCQTVTADSDGQWNALPAQPLTEGAHVITAAQTNNCGKTSDPVMVPFSVNPCLDCPEPEAPVITAPEDGAILNTPLPLIQGTAQPNAAVLVCVEDDCTTVMADEAGMWSLQVTDPLTDGTYQISASQTNECDCTSPPALSTFTIDLFVCPTPPAPLIVAPAPDEIVYDTQPYIVGQAEPENTVTVCVDSVCISTVANENGEWSIQVPEELAIGTHTVEATQTNACGETSTAASVSFSVAVPVNELDITELVRGQTFRTVDVTFEVGQMSGPWTVYYLLLDPNLPAPTEAEVIGYDDPATLTNGQVARGVFIQPQQSNVTVQRVLPGREVPSPLPEETGVMDGQRYILYMVGVVTVSQTTGLVYSPETAIGMPFAGGAGTAAQPFMIQELTVADFVDYPDLVAGHPANRAGVDETARQLDNIEGMQVLYDQDPQNGISGSLTLVYDIQTDFDLANYANAYGGNGWRPIGNYDATHYTPAVALHIFSGTLLGNSHAINNLSMTPTGQANTRWVQFVGFIGYALGATILNLTLSQVSVVPIPVLPAASGFAMRTAALCAYARNCTFEGLSVLAATLTMDFGANAATYIEAGGVAGELINGTTQDVHIEGVLLSDSSGTYNYYGGLAGYAHNDSFAQSIQNITVLSVSCTNFLGTSMYAGGMIGYCNAINGVTVETVGSQNTVLQAARAYSGGVIGYLRVAAPVSFAALTVSSPVIASQTSGYYTGGVIGYTQVYQALTMTGIDVHGANVRAAYASAGIIGWMSIQNGAQIDIGRFTVSATVQVNSSYGGGAFGQIDRYKTSTLYIHDGQVLAGSSITAAGNSGGLVGDLMHTTENSFAYIQNCQSAADVTGTGSNNGGLFGFCSVSALSNCKSTGRVSGGASLTGGFIGSGGPFYITGCVATGAVSGAAYVGGFVGSITVGTVLASDFAPFPATQNLVELCSVRAPFVTATGEYVGGFSGRSIGMTYDQCYVLAAVIAQTNNHAGGFIGHSYTPNPGLDDGLMQNCYAIGSVTGPGNMYGGLVGESRLPILNSYSAAEQVAGQTEIGGIAGACTRTTSTITASIALCGTVAAQGALSRRITASNTGPATLRNNYAVDSLVLIRNGVVVAPVVSTSGVDGGTVTLANLSAQLTAIGWNTTTIWDTATIATLGRPTLRNNPE